MKYGPLNTRIRSASATNDKLEKDFIKLNRVGIKKGIVSAHAQKQVRTLPVLNFFGFFDFIPA